MSGSAITLQKAVLNPRDEWRSPWSSGSGRLQRSRTSDGLVASRTREIAFPPLPFVAIYASGSIQQQLLQLHMTNRDLSLDALLPRVMIQRQTIVEDGCPSIRSRMNALAKAKIALPDPNVITLHPTVHRFVIETGGAQIDAARLIDSNDPVVRWAADTLKAFQACKAG